MTLTRRRFSTSLIAMPFLGNVAARASTDVDVAIIGAGAAGLAAAHEARSRGLSARIFEAASRIGGRVYTDRTLGAAFEAGAFYIHWAERNPWTTVAATLGVETVNDNQFWGGFDVFRRGQRLSPEERMRRRGGFGRLSRILDDEPGHVDMSFGEAARRLDSTAPDAANGMALLSLGEDPDRVSIRDYQRLDAGDDLVVPSGYGHLLERYGAPLEIALATPVHAVDYSGAAVLLKTSRGDVRARQVVVTVSVNVLKSGAIRFTPGLPGRVHSALDGLGMGALTKLALKVEAGERFGLSPWTQYFDTGEAGDLINFEFWPFGTDLVVAHFGGDYARGLAEAGEAAATAHVRQRLLAMLGSDASGKIREGRLAGWSANPLTLGGYSIAKPGHSGARDVLSEPIADRVWLAGEANAGSGSMTAGGAALAGRRAIGDILARRTGK